MLLLFIESRGFTDKLRGLIDDDTYRAFQNELQSHPEKGALIQGSGGVRKIRMRVPGSGKSGGARVIYLYLESHAIIYLPTLYTKKEQSDLTGDQKKSIRSIVQQIKKIYRDRL